MREDELRHFARVGAFALSGVVGQILKNYSNRFEKLQRRGLVFRSFCVTGAF